MLETSVSPCYNTLKEVIEHAFLENEFSTNRKYDGLQWLYKVIPNRGRNLGNVGRFQNIYRRRNSRVSKTRQAHPRSRNDTTKTSDKEKVPIVVLDSNVYFNAADSPGSLSAEILELAKKRKIHLVVSRYILDEAMTNLRMKSTPDACDRHSRIIPRIHPETLKPTDRLVQAYKNLTDPKDAPILALARMVEADFLLTLNLKHLINNQLLENLDLPFVIITPIGFIETLAGK